MSLWIFMLLAFAVETHEFNCGLRQFENTEDSREEYITDLIIRKPLRANKKCNVNWSRTYYTDDDGYIPVDCGRCSIYNLHVSAKRNTKHDPIVCSGLTAELFTSKMACMWKKTCILRYSPATIVWSEPNPDSSVPNCEGEEPGTVEVGYSCLDAGIHVDDVMKGFQAIHSLQGLVRSHNYDWKNRIAYSKYKKRYVMSISPPSDVVLSWKNYFVLLSVVTSNISMGDKLIMNDSNDVDVTLETDTCEISSWQVKDAHNISSSRVRLEFLLNVTSRSGAGFDICFQWFDMENTNATAIFTQTVEQCKRAMRTKNTDFPTFDMIRDTSKQEYQGFVRSHSGYPWNYPRNNTTSPFINVWTSEVLVLLAPYSLRHLKLQVVELKLGRGDRLRITDGQQKVSDHALRKTAEHDFKGQSVTFNFSVHHSSDQTSAGFLMCYQWYTPEQDNTIPKDLCSSFTYNVHPCGKGNENKKLLKEKCGLWKKPKKKGKKTQKHRNKIRNNKA